MTRFTQSLTAGDDGRADLRLVIEPPTGPDPRRERDIVLEIVGATSVEGLDGAYVATDETLSPALRVDLGRVDLTEGLDLTLSALTPARVDVEKEAFALLDAAEIAFLTKEAAWSAVSRLDGLALAQELTTIDLPESLRGALLERASAPMPW